MLGLKSSWSVPASQSRPRGHRGQLCKPLLASKEGADSPYPSRNVVTGGWAGGELGLRKFIEEGAEDGPSSVLPKPKGGKKKGGPGGDDSEDPSRLPGKDVVLGLPLVGGFAGGERGLRQFVETGNLEIDKKPDSRRQFSPLVVALLVAGFGVVGGLLLEDLTQIVEKSVEAGIPGLPKEGFVLDPNTKLALQGGLALLALTGTLVGVRAVVRQVRDGTAVLATQALNFGKVALFWVSVFAAIKFVLETT